MGILLLDCSSKKTEFGYYDDKGNLHKNVTNESGNADDFVYCIKNFFLVKDISIKEIDTVSISNGPGSFTGLRISSAIAKGICFSLGCKLSEVVTLDVIANKSSAEKEIISLVFSNSKSLEFYYSRYKKNHNELIRISDYKTAVPDEIISNTESEYLINEPLSDLIPNKYREFMKDVSDISNIESLLELTQKNISENNFGDFRTSIPFYMKEFIPKN